MYLFDQSILTGKPYPYWFGKTNLSCLISLGKKQREKREAPHRFEHALSHRWIKYRGYYFEFLGPGVVHVNSSSPLEAGSCSQHQESRIAGYGELDIDCITNCAEKYEKEFGTYTFLSNNCHRFANRISDILCQESSCPSWCNWRCRSY